VALVCPGHAEAVLADPAATEVARGLARALDRARVALLVGGAPPTPDGVVCFRDGAAPAGRPAVAVEPPGPRAGGVAVTSRVREGAAAAARHLAGLGHTALTVLAWEGCGPRLDGAREGWGDAGPLRILLAAGPHRPDGEPAARRALAMRPAPTAVLALSDALALEVLAAASHGGLRVPADLSVAGVDDLPGADAVGLTSVFVPYRPLGEMAGETLLALLDERPPPATPPLPSELVVRATTGPPAAARGG
jgi:LacI family transcriptional regulator